MVGDRPGREEENNRYVIVTVWLLEAGVSAGGETECSWKANNAMFLLLNVMKCSTLNNIIFLLKKKYIMAIYNTGLPIGR